VSFVKKGKHVTGHVDTSDVKTILKRRRKLKRAAEVWTKIFFRCKHLTSDKMCKSSNCCKNLQEEEDRWRCCIYCEERPTCLVRCKYTPFKEYMRGVEES